jgi:ribonuclease PH
MRRPDNRKSDELRPVTLIRDYISYPEGSVLFTMGNTKVICNSTVEPGVPTWMKMSGKPGGWITAEYSLLPRSTHTRTKRETRGLRGRTQEISRFIGRALRAGFDLGELGEHTCIVDCDVIQADGGTRTAAITGGYTSVVIALRKLVKSGEVSEKIFLHPISAVSVGIVGNRSLLDLNYQEDSAAEVDLNLVMNNRLEYIEVQGTAEGSPFTKSTLDRLLDLGTKGIKELFHIQQAVLNQNQAG